LERAKPAAKTIYTTHDVSRLLHVNPRSVINWIEQDRLQSFRTPGGHRRIRHDDLLSFLRKHQIPVPSALAGVQFGVLVVTDDADTTDLLRTHFEKAAGFTVTTASDGISAMIELGRARPDLMILDVKISGVDGADVCRRIKNDRTNKTAILAMSVQPEDKERIMQAGADGFLTKPLEIEVLESEARRLLQVL
jgi:excisionase family DNA binding protein